MKSKFGVLLVLFSFVLLSWVLYKLKLNTQNTKAKTLDSFQDSVRSADKVSGIGSSVSSNAQVRSINSKSVIAQDYIEDAKLIQIALEILNGAVKIPRNITPKITHRGIVAEIIWPIEPSPPGAIYPRGDYHALVQINRKSGKIIEVLGSP